MIDKFIPLAKPNFFSEDIQSVVEVLESGMLVQGEKVQQLENTFSNYHQCKQSIALSNGTATLHLALLALGVKAGDEVIVPAFSYVATANVVELVGATCVFVDIDISTFNIDVSKIEENITSKTRAIIPVHEFGLASDIEKIMIIAKKYNLAVIEDAACALGAKQGNKLVGTFGDFGSFSMHPRKSITCGEGGILTTNDNLLAKKIRQLRNHGIELVDGAMDFVSAGFNYRLTEFQAVLISCQMRRLEKIIEKKQELATVYLHEINNKDILLPSIPNDRNHTWQTFHVVNYSSKSQKEILSFLKSKNIGSNYGAQCIPATTFYQKKYDLDYKNKFFNAYQAYVQGFALPIYEQLTFEQVNQIAKIINLI